MDEQEQIAYLVELGLWTTTGLDSIWTSRKAADDRAAQIDQEIGIADYATVSTFVLNKPNGER